MKGKAYRRFLVWLNPTGGARLSDYSNLYQLFHHYKEVVDVFSKQIGDFDYAVMDSVLCEAIHTRREGCKSKWVGKSKSKGRWVVEIRVVAIVSPEGDILAWQMDKAHVHDKYCVWMVEDFEIKVLTDAGCHSKEGDHENLTTIAHCCCL